MWPKLLTYLPLSWHLAAICLAWHVRASSPWLSRATRCWLRKLRGINPLTPPGFPPSHQAQAVSCVWKACILSLTPLSRQAGDPTNSLHKSLSTWYDNALLTLEVRLLRSHCPYFHEHWARHTGWGGVPTDASRMN